MKIFSKRTKSYNLLICILLIMLSLLVANTKVCLCQELKKTSSGKKLESRLKSDEKLDDLNGIANDLEKEPFERAKAVATIFANHIKTGQTAKDMNEIFGDNLWVGAAEITECREQEINDLLGQTDYNIVFSIALASDAEGWSPWNIYLSLPKLEEIDEFYVRLFLEGFSKKSDTSHIQKFAISYPDGWIEVFAENGIIIACYSEKTLLVRELLMKEVLSKGGRTGIWFLSFEDDENAARKFLKRFDGFSVTVKGEWEAKINKDGVWDKATDKQAFLVRAEVYRWLSKDRAEVECGDYHGPLAETGTSGVIELEGKVLKWIKTFSNWES